MHHEVAVVVQQPVVEVDHAADELRREDADAAIVEQIDAAGCAPLIEHGVIAEMRIAVDHAEAAEWEPPCGEHRASNYVALRERRALVREQLAAFEPVER